MFGLKEIHKCECISCKKKRIRDRNWERKKLGLKQIPKPPWPDMRLGPKIACSCDYCKYRAAYVRKRKQSCHFSKSATFQ